MVLWPQKNLVSPSQLRISLVARFLGPGFNQFQNWTNQNEDSGESSEEEGGAGEQRKPRQQEDDKESWTDWKNGEDYRHRFAWRVRPGRIIHLGDGSELFTDRTEADEDHIMPMSSSEDESEGDDTEKMHVDGVPHESQADHNVGHHPAETVTEPLRYKSPAPLYSNPGELEHPANEM